MFVCAKCFANGELKADVSSSARNNVCDIFQETDKIKDLTEYEPFFCELLGLFTKAEKGKNIVDLIDEDWNIFCNSDVARRILAEIIKDHDFGYTLDDSVDYNNAIKERVSVWDNLKNNVKYKSRFFNSIEEFNQYHYLSASYELKAGKELYRARIMTDGIQFPRDRMGCPPKESSKPGRANPIGIPYLYLCDDPKTTYYEVRAVYLDNLSVGTFKVLHDLNIVDFTYKVDIYGEFTRRDSSLKEIVIQTKIMEAISKDLSKPLRRFDSELEYVPTQMICEYCRNIVQADGISFESSLYKGGINYVLFDQDNAECVSVDTHVIRKIDIDKG